MVASNTTCADVTNSTLRFAYTVSANGTRTVELLTKAANCSGTTVANRYAVSVNVTRGANTFLDVPFARFAQLGADLKKVHGLVWKGGEMNLTTIAVLPPTTVSPVVAASDAKAAIGDVSTPPTVMSMQALAGAGGAAVLLLAAVAFHRRRDDARVIHARVAADDAEAAFEQGHSMA